MSKDLYNIKDVIDYQIGRVGRNSPLSYQDMYQLGYLGYLIAQKNYKAEFGSMTLKYASMYIRAEILTAIKKERRYNHTHLIPRDSDDEDPNALENVPQPDTSHPVDVDKLQDIRIAMNVLDPLERELIEGMYFDTEIVRPVDLAAKHGKSPESMHYIRRKAMKKIKQRLKK